MALPTAREELKQYCLRRLGFPVIEINIDDAQIEDRIDDALQFFTEYHFDGVERCYIRKQITQTDIDNKYIDLLATTAEDTANGVLAAPAIDPEGKSIITVIRCFQLFGNMTGGGMFDIRYQMALNDMYGLRTNNYSGAMSEYNMVRSHMQMLQDMLTPEKAITFSRVTNKIYIDMDWKYQTSIGQYLMFEAYRALDPEVYGEIYNDRLLKLYATAKIKEQWGANLSKFSGVVLAGGITLNGSEIYSEARQEIEKLESEVQSKYETPPQFYVG